jgi:basic amino acid/polyamine antiporter, APA family
LSITRDQDSSTTAPAPTPTRVYSRNATGLVREVRLIDQVVYNLGSVTPLTSALAVGLFTIAAFPRMNIYVALLVPAIASLPLWITWSLLTATFPKTGGDYVFNSRILHPAIGFGVNLGFLFANVLTAAFAAGFLAELAINPTLLIIGTVTKSSTISGWADTFTVDNKTGVFVTSALCILFVCALAAIRSRLLLRVMTVMVMIFAVGAIVDIIILFATSKGGFANTFNSYAGAGAYDKVVAAGAGKGLYPSEGGYSTSNTLGAMFVWVGFSIFVVYGAYIAGEVRRAGDRRRMLVSIAGSGVLQTVFLLISIIAFYGAVGENFAISAVAGNQGTGIASFPYYAALATGSPVLAVVVAVAFLLWAIPTLNVFMGVIQRGVFVYSFERLLPSAVSKVNARTHTPLLAVAIMGALSLIAAAFLSYNANFSVALTLAILPGFVAMFVVAISAVVMPLRRRDLYEGSPADWRVAGIPVLPVCGFLSAIVLAFFIVLPFYFQDELGLTSHSWLPVATAIAPIAVLALGIVWWLAARAYHRRRGVDLDLLYRTIPPD